MELKDIKHILKKLKEEMEIEDDIQIRLKPMKKKLATISLRSKEIRLNSNLVCSLSEEEIKIILIHELLHLKYGIFHTSEFLEDLANLKNRIYQRKI